MDAIRKNWNKKQRGGAALIVVLLIVMAITILSLGFLSRCDVDLACGKNMVLRTSIDYLAESGLEHAKGLLLNPQDVNISPSGYWAGCTRQQLVNGSDYYDISVAQKSLCNYQVTCTAYRETSGQQSGRSVLSGELRFNPCIAYWRGSSGIIVPGVTVNGDVYYNGNLQINGIVNGDAYAAGSIWGTGRGQKYSGVSSPTISAPNIHVTDFSSTYYIGSTRYSVGILGSSLSNVTKGPTASNPAGIYYCSDNLMLMGTVKITGTLVVRNNLILANSCNVTITSVQNFPAILVGNDMTVERDWTWNWGEWAGLTATGYVQVDHQIDVQNQSCVSMIFNGAVCIPSVGIANIPAGSNITINAAPLRAALQIWPTSGHAVRWSPAAGAFFKSITRQ